MERKLIFNKDRGCQNASFINPSGDMDPAEVFSRDILREDLPLCDIAESEVIRHYMELARLNFSVDTNFYPLGSCTMKYNPKINEYLSGLSGFRRIHPFQRDDDLQGALELMYELENLFCEMTGMKAFAFGPSSGAQGELTGILMIRKFHEINGSRKSKIIVPDSAHGTNPATAAMCGYKTVVIESSSEGLVDIDKLEKLIDNDVAALMLTNPNTLGLFEKDILKISQMVHERGGLLYYDGANFNPLLAIAKPALMGFDVMHLNLHKTFSTPHGCGGPGAGVVGAADVLKDFLPLPRIKKRNKNFYLDYSGEKSIGKPRSFFGNFDVFVKAYAYILRLGKEGLKRVAQNSVLNANYLSKKLEKYYRPVSARCMHEVVFSCSSQKEKGVSALDIAKRLIDYGIHPPTMYFPLIVKEALMVEPTETESKEVLDYFIRAMVEINKEIEREPQKLKSSPYNAPVGRVDETRAARFPVLADIPRERLNKTEKI